MDQSGRNLASSPRMLLGEVLYLNSGLSFLKQYFVLYNGCPSPVCAVCLGQAEGVFSNMVGDFMRPVVDVVDQLLTAGVNVTIYNGQLDLIVDTMGNLLSVLPSVQHEQQCCLCCKPIHISSSSAESCATWISTSCHMICTCCFRSGAVGEEAEVGGAAWV